MFHNSYQIPQQSLSRNNWSINFYGPRVVIEANFMINAWGDQASSWIIDNPVSLRIGNPDSSCDINARSLLAHNLPAAPPVSTRPGLIKQIGMTLNIERQTDEGGRGQDYVGSEYRIIPETWCGDDDMLDPSSSSHSLTCTS